MLSDAVFERLAGDAAVIGMVAAAGDSAPCIFWGQRDQGSALPALVLEWVGGPPEDLDLQDEADSVESRLQCTALAATHSDASDLANAATLALLDDADIGGFLFWGADRERPIDLTAQGPAQSIMHEVTQDVLIRHLRAV